MFLDEQLLEIYRNNSVKSLQGWKSTYVKLITLWENRLISTITIGTNYSDCKKMIDQVFNSWDLFVKNLSKDKDKYSLNFAEFCKQFNYKNEFMKNEELCNFYNSIKNK